MDSNTINYNEEVLKAGLIVSGVSILLTMIVYIVDLELNSNSLSEMINLYSSINELGPYDNILFDPNINYNSGDQIILGFVESTDINLLEAGVKTISVLQRNQPLYAAGAILGEFEFGNAKLSENYIYYERRGQC